MQTTLGTPTVSAVVFFGLIVLLTLAITWWAARRTRSTREFYAAGRRVSPFQNGLALAGDYMSAASFLGIAGLVALRGYDGMIYATGWLVGWPALMFLIAEPLRFDLDAGALYAAVGAKYGQAAVGPGGLVTDPVDAISLGLALMFGLLGLPHILMRFYTVRDARAARLSVLYATGFIGYFYLIIPIVGFAAATFVGRDAIRRIDAGGNMAAPLLAEFLGGTAFLRFIAAVAFATIVAVVAGLTLAGAAALA